MKLERHDFDERELLGRMMRNMQGTSRWGDQRWVLVMRAFGFGSTVANAMCHEFGLDPDEVLKKPRTAR